MIKNRMLWLVASLLAVCCNLRAQNDVPLDDNAMYFDIDDLPNAVAWLPEPPDTTSTAFVYDITQYMWGKEQRLNQERAQQAVENAVMEIGEMAEQFSVPFGMEITEEKTPAIYKVLYRGVLTVRRCATKPKSEYMRQRPYARFHEPTLVPEDEETLRLNGSYPSGHTVRGWAMALLLCEINPSAQDALLKLGYEWGQSRVIAGYHWQSDVDAARMVAAAGYARLHTHAEFLADIAAARAEYAALTGGVSAAPSLTASAAEPSAAIYDMQGKQLSGQPRTGVYIQGGKKVMTR